MTSGPEFIDREHQLPADVRLTPPDVAGDVASLRALAIAPHGEPPADYTVRSIFDSRPLQGYDFNIICPTDEFNGDEVFSFTVPSGVVAVVREFKHFFTNPSATNKNPSGTLVSFQKNGANIQYNHDIPVGADTIANPVKLFFVADEFDVVSARLVGAVNGTHIAYVWFYGNFLLKTGRPATFEIANKAGEGKTSTIKQTGYADPGNGG
jgi:hypothetical protein